MKFISPVTNVCSDTAQYLLATDPRTSVFKTSVSTEPLPITNVSAHKDTPSRSMTVLRIHAMRVVISVIQKPILGTVTPVQPATMTSHQTLPTSIVYLSVLLATALDHVHSMHLLSTFSSGTSTFHQLALPTPAQVDSPGPYIRQLQVAAQLKIVEFTSTVLVTDTSKSRDWC